MPWPSLLTAMVTAAVTTAATPWVLRRLPRPPEAPDYPALATPRLLVAVGALTLVVTGLVTCLTPVAHWLAWASLAVVNVWAVVIDARTTWLPAALSRIGWGVAAVGVATAALVRGELGPVGAAALGAVTVGGFFHALWAWTRQVGYGDVRLAATIGAVAALEGGATLTAAAVLAGTCAGAVWGLAHRAGRHTGPFPYGPGLWSGPFLALVWWAVSGAL
ncbi:prepilin peptidase [Propioniciclava soli]|uniref:prepilin peptidase n=1 Tax=Propioniciclava soli TaxID=2775081 RepID=UPI001E3190E9